MTDDDFVICAYGPRHLRLAILGDVHRPGLILLAGLLFVGSHAARAQTASPLTAADLVRRALQANGELAAARLDLDRARAQRVQAGLRPNPTVDARTASGRLAGSEDEWDISAALTVPFELGGKRQRRIDLAEAERAVAEADVADRERRLTLQVLSAYADALAAARDLQITDGVRDLDDQSVRVVRTRVEQRDAAPLELNLLLTEVARLRSQRALAQGRLDAALTTLRTLIGASPTEPLAIADAQAALTASPITVPSTLDAAIATALETRPDLRLARVTEEAAAAGLRLARADAVPDLALSAGYTTSRSFVTPDNAPVPLARNDRALTIGVSIPVPFTSRNQGAIADAGLAMRQARLRREYAEQTIRTEVTGAYQRLQAAQAATAIFEQSVTMQATDNLRVMRSAYQLGEFRITDVITQQQQVLSAEREYASALADRYHAAVDLAAAMGTLPGGRP